MLSDDNICVSDAQYYEPGAQQNLWCEILEFERFGITCLYTACYAVFRTKRREIRLANEPFYAAIEPLLHYNTAAVVIQ